MNRTLGEIAMNADFKLCWCAVARLEMPLIHNLSLHFEALGRAGK
jgi:hypothetical protein